VEVGAPILLIPSPNLASIDGFGLEAELSGGKEARSNTAVLLGPMAPVNFVPSLTASWKWRFSSSTMFGAGIGSIFAGAFTNGSEFAPRPT